MVQGNAKFEFVEESGSNIPAERYTNPDGSIGGWVAINAVVEEGAYIEPGAMVPPGSHIKQNDHVYANEILSVETDQD